MVLSENDDIELEMYYYLWLISKTYRERLLNFRISQSVYFMEGRPVCWYFNGKKGSILQKGTKNTIIEEVRKKFLRSQRVSLERFHRAIDEKDKQDEWFQYDPEKFVWYFLRHITIVVKDDGKKYVIVPDIYEGEYKFKREYNNSIEIYKQSKKTLFYFQRQNKDTPKCQERASTDNKIYFFDELEFLKFCNNPKSYGYGVLQKNQVKNTPNLKVLQTVWSPHLCLVERLVYDGKISDSNNGAPQLQEKGKLPELPQNINPNGKNHNSSIKNIRNYQENVSYYICELSENMFDIRRMKVFFAIDHKEQLHFLWVESLRFHNSKEKMLRPLPLERQLQVITSENYEQIPNCFFCDMPKGVNILKLRKHDFTNIYQDDNALLDTEDVQHQRIITQVDKTVLQHLGKIRHERGDKIMTEAVRDKKDLYKRKSLKSISDEPSVKIQLSDDQEWYRLNVCVECINKKAECLKKVEFFLEKNVDYTINERNKSLIICENTMKQLRALQDKVKGKRVLVKGIALSGMNNQQIKYKKLGSEGSFRSINSNYESYSINSERNIKPHNVLEINSRDTSIPGFSRFLTNKGGVSHQDNDKTDQIDTIYSSSQEGKNIDRINEDFTVPDQPIRQKESNLKIGKNVDLEGFLSPFEMKKRTYSQQHSRNYTFDSNSPSTGKSVQTKIQGQSRNSSEKINTQNNQKQGSRKVSKDSISQGTSDQIDIDKIREKFIPVKMLNAAIISSVVMHSSEKKKKILINNFQEKPTTKETARSRNSQKKSERVSQEPLIKQNNDTKANFFKKKKTKKVEKGHQENQASIYAPPQKEKITLPNANQLNSGSLTSSGPRKKTSSSLSQKPSSKSQKSSTLKPVESYNNSPDLLSPNHSLQPSPVMISKNLKSIIKDPRASKKDASNDRKRVELPEDRQYKLNFFYEKGTDCNKQKSFIFKDDCVEISTEFSIHKIKQNRSGDMSTMAIGDTSNISNSIRVNDSIKIQKKSPVLSKRKRLTVNEQDNTPVPVIGQIEDQKEKNKGELVKPRIQKKILEKLDNFNDKLEIQKEADKRLNNKLEIQKEADKRLNDKLEMQKEIDRRFNEKLEKQKEIDRIFNEKLEIQKEIDRANRPISQRNETDKDNQQNSEKKDNLKERTKKDREQHRHDVLMNKIEKEFKAYDKNDDGKQGTEEFMGFVQKIVGQAGRNNSIATRAMFDDIFRDCDQNQDGEITLEEFKNSYGKYYRKI